MTFSETVLIFPIPLHFPRLLFSLVHQHFAITHKPRKVSENLFSGVFVFTISTPRELTPQTAPCLTQKREEIALKPSPKHQQKLQFFSKKPSGAACCCGWEYFLPPNTEYMFCVCRVFYFLCRRLDGEVWIISDEFAQRASSTTTRTTFRPSAKCINISLLFNPFFFRKFKPDLFESLRSKSVFNFTDNLLILLCLVEVAVAVNAAYLLCMLFRGGKKYINLLALSTLFIAFFHVSSKQFGVFPSNPVLNLVPIIKLSF